MDSASASFKTLLGTHSGKAIRRDACAPAVQRAGITTQPKVQFYPVHNIYVPNLEVIRKAGSSSMPSAA